MNYYKLKNIKYKNNTLIVIFFGIVGILLFLLIFHALIPLVFLQQFRLSFSFDFLLSCLFNDTNLARDYLDALKNSPV